MQSMYDYKPYYMTAQHVRTVLMALEDLRDDSAHRPVKRSYVQEAIECLEPQDRLRRLPRIAGGLPSAFERWFADACVQDAEGCVSEDELLTSMALWCRAAHEEFPELENEYRGGALLALHRRVAVTMPVTGGRVKRRKTYPGLGFRGAA